MTEQEIIQKIDDTAAAKARDGGRSSYKYNEILADLVAQLVRARSGK